MLDIKLREKFLTNKFGTDYSAFDSVRKIIKQIVASDDNFCEEHSDLLCVHQGVFHDVVIEIKILDLNLIVSYAFNFDQTGKLRLEGTGVPISVTESIKTTQEQFDQYKTALIPIVNRLKIALNTFRI